MKHVIAVAVFCAAMLGWSDFAAPASAQQEAIVTAQGNPYFNDFLALNAKRPILRSAINIKGMNVAFSEWLRQEHPRAFERYAGLHRGYAHRSEGTGKPACCATAAETAHGNPNLSDFFALSGKRTDLRGSITRNGLDKAFAEWLRAERPHAHNCCK